MVNTGDPTKSPDNPENPSKKQPEVSEEGTRNEILFSPRFRSVAAMAGWDEEALLIASLIVEDTPDRQFKQRKRSDLQNLKTPPTNSRRKRRARRSSPTSTRVTVLDLDEDDSASKQESEKKKIDVSFSKIVEKNRGEDEVDTKNSGVSRPSIPCIDRLREELSCAICLEICYEPSTTACGHSFCRKCLRSASDKCGKKCPKCRHIISNGRYCTVNTVLWNTIQLLFPQEIEARKTANALDATETRAKSPARIRHHNVRNRSIQALNSPESDTTAPERRNHRRIRNQSLRATEMVSWGEVGRRTDLPSQDEDAALALRLQREEFMESFRVPDEHRSRSRSLAVARANLRAMASRAIKIRVRGRTE